ncbi:unnamed protein product [Closterium sp. Yama58-4]|nr:unnamed protein product [Closterium sp. Yama58-4]
MERRKALWMALVVLAIIIILCRETPSCAALDVSGAQRGMQFVRLNQTNIYHGKCLDGSEPGYYIRTGNKRGAQNWVVHLMMNEFGAGFAGILSRRGRENPTFNDWNAVLVVYCDGGLYGRLARRVHRQHDEPVLPRRPRLARQRHSRYAPLVVRPIRGTRVSRSCTRLPSFPASRFAEHFPPPLPPSTRPPSPCPRADLRLRGLGSARNVLFSGCSAGAQAVAMTCDAMARAFPSANVKCLMDAGFFLDTPDIQGRLTWRQSVERLFKFHRMGQGTPPACRQGQCACGHHSHTPCVGQCACWHGRVWSGWLFKFHRMGQGTPPACHQAHAQQPWKCLLPQYNLPFLRTHLLVVNSLQDEIAVKMTFAPPSLISPLSPLSSHTAHAQQPWKCLLPQYNLPFLRTPLMVVNSLQDEIAVKMTFAPPLINGTVRIQKCIDNSPLCPAPYRTALHLYQSRLARTVLAIQHAKRRQGVWFESFLMNSTSHCSAVYGDWVGKVDVLGRQLPRVVEEWFFHGRGGGAGVPGGLVGSGGVKRGGNGTGAGGVGAGQSGGGEAGAGGAGAGAGGAGAWPGGVGKGGAWAGQKGNKGGRAGGRPIPRPPKVPGVQAGSAGAGKLPSKRGADQMGTGGSEGGGKGGGGAAGKGQQQQRAGKSTVKRPGTGIGKGPGVGAGAGKAPGVGAGAGKAAGGRRGALWPGVRGRNEGEEAEQARPIAVEAKL